MFPGKPMGSPEEEDGDLAQELQLMQELKEYARDNKGKEMVTSMGKEVDDGSMPDEQASFEEVPGAEPEGDDSADPLKDIDPEMLKMLMAQLGSKGA
jgi:hypothetical protein